MVTENNNEIYIFADESGSVVPYNTDDNNKINENDCPVFVYAVCVFENINDITEAVTYMASFKIKHFGHDGIILHYTDLHRCSENEDKKSKGNKQIRNDKYSHKEFIDDLLAVLVKTKFTIISSAINLQTVLIIKQAKAEGLNKLITKLQMAKSKSVYPLALLFCIERVNIYLAKKGYNFPVTIISESVQNKINKHIKSVFNNVCNKNNFNKELYNQSLEFVKKTRNATGLQFADLVAQPIAKKAHSVNINDNASFETQDINIDYNKDYYKKCEIDVLFYNAIYAKLDKNTNNKVDGYGIKMYPSKQDISNYETRSKIGIYQ